MGGLFKSQSVDSSAPVISSIQLQTSAFGRPITWIFGRRRVAPNLIQYDDFTSIAHTSRQKTGKGGSGAPASTDYTYQVAAIMALGSGELQSIGRVWKDKEKTSLDELRMDFYSGDEQQEPHPYFATKHPDRALAYRGISYVASGAYDLGSNASFGNHTFEVQAPNSISANHAGAEIPDAELADVITSLLTDPEQGVGLDASTLGDMTAFRQFCLANKLWVSPAYTEQRGAYEYIKTLLTIGFADCVYSGGKFKIVPYSDVPATGELATYTPTIVPVCNLGEDDFIGDEGSDVIRISQKSSEESYNHVRVRFADRANEYNDNIAESKDDADIEQHGLRSMDVVDIKEIADAAVAQKVADFILRRALYILNTYKFRLPWKHVRLEPMDVVTLTYAPKFLDSTPVLITEIEEDEDGLLSITAEDYPMGSNRHAEHAPPEIGSTAPNYAVAPGDANAPVLFEPPAKLTAGDTQLWLAASGGEHWGGAVVWASLDDQSYQRIGTVRGSARHGVLSAPLPAGGAVDSTNVLAVDLSVSRGELIGGTEDAARDLITASYVGGEYLAFAHEALVGPSAYHLSYLVRGAFGSSIDAHAAGTPFVFLDSAVFRYAYPHDWIGKTVYIKLTSFNEFGGAMQDLSSVETHTHVLEGGTMGAPGYLTAAERVFGVQLTWGLPASSEYLDATELWWSDTPQLQAASLLVSVAAPQNAYMVSGLGAGERRYFWIRFVDRTGRPGPFYPDGAGVAGTSSSDAKAILDWLAGQIGKTQLAKDLLKSIELIDGLSDIRDSIAASHLTGMMAAHNAVVKEASTRADALLAEAEARGAAITTVQTSVQTKTDALASRIDTVTAATNANAAAVQQEVTARTNATSALASSILTVAAKTDANQAAIVEERTARTDQAGALASSISVVSANTGANAAAISEERTARTNADGALATEISAVSASTGANAAAILEERTARTNADGALATSITAVQAKTDANAAAIVTEQTARTNADGALATSISAVQTKTDANAAAIITEQTARSNAVSALATTISTVQATANGASSAVQTVSSALAQTNGDLSAMHTIKTEVTAGGRTILAGIGLGVDSRGGLVESQILLSAQRVAILDESGGAVVTPFVVQGGQVIINQAFIGSASIDTLQLAGQAVTVPLHLSGYGGASNVSSGQNIQVGSVSGYFNAGATIVALVTWQVLCGAQNTNTSVTLSMDGQPFHYVSDSTLAGMAMSHATSGRTTCGSGMHSFSISFGNDWPGNYNLANWAVTFLGVKK